MAEKATPIIVNQRIQVSGLEISMCCFYVTHYSQKRITLDQVEQRREGRP